MALICSRLDGAVGLYEYYNFPKDRFDRLVWVCAGCYRPSLAVFREYIRKCDNCGKRYSGPWSDVCFKCLKDEDVLNNLELGTRLRRPVKVDGERVGDWTWGRLKAEGAGMRPILGHTGAY